MSLTCGKMHARDSTIDATLTCAQSYDSQQDCLLMPVSIRIIITIGMIYAHALATFVSH